MERKNGIAIVRTFACNKDRWKHYSRKEMFYKQIILQRGLPFEVKISSARPVDISKLSEAEFNEELEKGYADMQAGRTKNAKKAFADIRKDYGL